MTFLVALAVLVMLWLAITALLISGLWIFPLFNPPLAYGFGDFCAEIMGCLGRCASGQ